MQIKYYKKLPEKLQKQRECGAVDYETSHGVNVSYTHYG